MKAGGDSGAALPRYPIRAVARLTGIAIDTLRAWERRYAAVTPSRDDRGRLYSEADVARLRLIRQAVAAGHGVGRVATLSDDQLRALAMSASVEGTPVAPTSSVRLDTSAFSGALARLDSVAVDREFSRLAAVLPPLELIRDVLMPALATVGNDCLKKQAGIAQEHLVSAAMRNMLGSFLRLYARHDAPVRLLFATVAGDRHEIGTLGAAMLAASSGLAVSYVGPDLPAEDVVQAVKASGANVLVLGLTLYRRGVEQGRQLRTVVRDLPADVELWVGGRSADHHATLIGRRGIVLHDFDAFQQQLARLRERTA